MGMMQDTAERLVDHSRECGGKEFTYSSKFDQASGDRTKTYTCRKCGHAEQEVVNRKKEVLQKEAA